MAEEFERKADKSVVDEDFDQAVSLYSQALDLDPDNASLLVSRAAAYIKLQSYTDAVADANRALELSPGLSKAHLRKGTACFYLEEYQTAKAAFQAGMTVDPTNSQLKTWIRKCDAELIEEAAAEKRDAAAFSSPAATEKEPISGVQAPPVQAANGASRADRENVECSTPAVTAAPMPPQPKYRHEWYQTQMQTVVTVFAKNVKQDQLRVEFGDQILSVVIERPDEEAYSLVLRLFGKIKPSDSKYNILGTKVEIRLAKAETAQWKGLVYDPAQTYVPTPSSVPTAKPAPRKPAKNWDQLEAEVKKAEKDEKLEGDAALNKLFQDIYRNADEDTRRAMNKSFVESNGTVLSTNWKEVGSKNVDGSPPKGMEMKKWEQ